MRDEDRGILINNNKKGLYKIHGNNGWRIGKNQKTKTVLKKKQNKINNGEKLNNYNLINIIISGQEIIIIINKLHTYTKS
jgi:hypothetical protein